MRLSSHSRTLSTLLGAFVASTSVHATSFSITGRPRAAMPEHLAKRVDMNGSFGNGSTILSDAGDTIYSCNLTLGGTEFEVLIDTGSSDLWVIGNVPGTKNLSIPASVNYAEGSAAGFINTATLVFDEFTVDDQAYINVIPSPNNPATPGLIGLGPSSLSSVRSLVKTSAGDPPLDRIFRQNTSTPNFISVLLSRDSDASPGGTAPQNGQLTVGSVIPSYESITKQPKLPALVDQFGIQHWETVLDANGIIGPDGQNITTNTTISNPSTGTKSQLHVAFDTGFTFPQVPQNVADAIYGRVPGAEFVTQETSPGYWRIPCSYELNISFSLGGVKYPIHPLDLTQVESTDSSGNPKTCMATFQQIAPDIADHSSFGAFDAILGMAFLRNVYLLIDFGDFVDGSSSSVGDPYIQILSTTDPSSAHTDFVNTRLGGIDTTNTQAALLSEADAQHSPATSSNSADTNNLKNDLDNAAHKVKNLFYKSVWFIVAVAVGGALLLGLLGWCVFASCCRARRSNVRREAAFVPTMVGAGSYAPLRDPVQGGGVPPYGQGYRTSTDAGYGGGYGGYAEPKYQYGGRGV